MHPHVEASQTLCQYHARSLQHLTHYRYQIPFCLQYHYRWVNFQDLLGRTNRISGPDSFFGFGHHVQLRVTTSPAAEQAYRTVRKHTTSES